MTNQQWQIPAGNSSWRWVKILAIAVVVLIVAIALVPFFVNADAFRPKVEAELSSALGRPVTMSHLSLSIFSGSLVADNISIADDPAFGSSPFFAARSLHIAVSMRELLLHRQLHIAGFTADAPSIQLIPDGHGNWNYSSLGRKSDASPGSSTAPSELSVDRFEIKNGSLTVAPLSPRGKPVVYDHVDLVVEHLSLSNPMPFTLAADLPAGGSIKLSGTTGPLAQPNAASTPLQASFTATKLDPVAAGLIESGSGIAMTADIDGQTASDGKTLTVNGKVKASHLKLAANGKPAAKPVEIDLNVAEDLGKESGTVRDIALHTGSIAAHLTGTFQMAASGVTLNLHLAAPSLPVDALEELLPSAGVTLPTGSSLHGGTLTANLDITGPATSPRIAGPIEIDNTELAGFDLATKIQGLMKPLGSSPSGGTAIRQLRTDAINTAQSTQLNNIVLNVPNLGTATGSGTVSAANDLNFEVTAKLAAADPASIGASILGSAAGLTVPISVTGNASNPSIHVHAGALLKQNANTLLDSVKKGDTKSGIAGFFKSLIHK